MFLLVVSLLISTVAATPTCCWTKWGDASSCGSYVGSGGLCNTDWSKHCSANTDCPATPVPTPPPGPPAPPSPPAPPPPVPPHPPAPPAPPLPEKTSQEVLGWLENWGPDVSWWDQNIPENCLMGCMKAKPFLNLTTPYSSINYGFAFLTQNPDAAQVGCGTKKPAGACPVWDGQSIYLAAAAKQGAIAVNSATDISRVSPAIISIADVVRMARMHPAGPKRAKITLGGWSDYARLGTAANGIKVAKLVGKLVAFTFADGIDIDMEHLTPYSGFGDEFGALIAFFTQLRTEFDLVSKNWVAQANARIKALTSQFKAACGRCPAQKRHWYLTNIKHLEEVASNGAPHLEISWTTRFNAFLPSNEVPDVWNYLMPDSAKPDKFFRFATDNEGKQFYPQVHHLIDTVNIMAYDAGAIKGVPLKLNFTTILNNFVSYGNVTPSKINMGFEPGPQAAGGKWEGPELDEATATDIAEKKTGGGVAVWAINPTPSKTNNASLYTRQVSKALNEIIKPTYPYGKAPNFTKCGPDGMWPGLADEIMI